MVDTETKGTKGEGNPPAESQGSEQTPLLSEPPTEPRCS